MPVVVIVVVGAVAALVGVIVGYLWGRSDERDNAAVTESCGEGSKYEESEHYCVYRGTTSNNNTFTIHIPKAIMRHFELPQCPAKVRVCWKTPKGASTPSITQVEAL